MHHYWTYLTLQSCLKIAVIYISIAVTHAEIDQKVDEEWPLTVIDHKMERAKIFLKPGEMLLYESAKMPHGRQFPFNGDYFDNVFVRFSFLHYKSMETL